MMKKIITAPIIVAIIICGLLYLWIMIQSCQEISSTPTSTTPPNTSESKVVAVNSIDSYKKTIAALAAKYQFEALDLEALMMVLSGGQPFVEGPEMKNGRACGIMQLLPQTANEINPKIVWEEGEMKQIATELGIQNMNVKKIISCDDLKKSPTLSLILGAKLLSEFLKLDDSNCHGFDNGKLRVIDEKVRFIMAVAAYNAGPTSLCSSKQCPGFAIWECDKNPNFIETRVFVERFKATKNNFPPINK